MCLHSLDKAGVGGLSYSSTLKAPLFPSSPVSSPCDILLLTLLMPVALLICPSLSHAFSFQMSLPL